MAENTDSWPELSMPEAEASRLEVEYKKAGVILEYGSGGSTVLASRFSGKRIFSVESDFNWALRLQSRIDELNLPSPATIHYVDIGPTGEWGRPVDSRQWEKFWHYPAGVWDEPFFRHPDVVLIDGRFRPACFATILMRITRPVRILFDDYVTRPVYHDVERILSPVETVGRMAVFDALPELIRLELSGWLLDTFFRATYPDQHNYADRNANGSGKPAR